MLLACRRVCMEHVSQWRLACAKRAVGGPASSTQSAGMKSGTCMYQSRQRASANSTPLLTEQCGAWRAESHLVDPAWRLLQQPAACC